MQLVCQREIVLPRFHRGSVISLADGGFFFFFNEECNYLNRSAKDTLLLLLLLLLPPACCFSAHLRGSSWRKKKSEHCLQLLLPSSVSSPSPGLSHSHSLTDAAWMTYFFLIK